MRCPKCAHDNAAASRFCANCGARLESACPACGAPVAAGQKFCSACGHALASPARPAAVAPPEPEGGAEGGGERRYATVMFADLSGYTALNERLDPEEVEEIMGRVKRKATEIVERHGGTVNQFVGDEVMALFGIPRAHRDDPRHALRAALELHEAVRALGLEFEARIGQRVALHTGINTGLVVARRSDSHAGRFLLTGDTVNTAARLLKLAQTGEIVVSQETWRQVSEFFEARAGAPVAVKGKEHPVVPYRISRERTSRETGLRPLVGRAEEMRQWGALAQMCRERGRGRVVLLRGDPGIGKSRLVAEFLQHAQALGFSCHGALVLDFGAETGRDAVRSLARSLLGAAPDAGEAARQDAIARACAQGLVGAEREVFLYDLLGVPAPMALRAIHAAMSVQARERGTLEALGEMARNAAERQPRVLLVEDIHWADARTLEGLAALCAVAASRPLLVVMTSRFEGDPSSGAWRGALRGVPITSIDLGPLAAEEATDLAARFSSMPESVVRSCIERADGNPLFLEQLLLNAESTALDNLPGSIQALVLARLDRLEPVHKAALQAAAVLGQRFSLEALRHLLEDPAYECAPLVERFLVQPDGAEYLFCHALIRDGARESLLKSRRRQMHARAGEWFEARDPVLAAEHFERASDPRAARACLAASEAEAAQFRFASALALAERGLALAALPAERFALRAARAKLLLESGRAKESIEASRAALEAAASPAERAQALISLAAGMRINDRYDEGLAALEEAQPLAEQAGLTRQLSQLHHLRGNLYFPLSRLEECLREHQAAIGYAREAGSIEAEAAALGGLGDAHYLRGRMRSSHEQFRRCVELCGKHGLGRIQVANLHMLGWTAEYLGDLRGAVEVGREAIKLAEKVAHPRAEMLARLLVALVDGWMRGDLDHGEHQLDKAAPLIQALGAKRFEAFRLQFAALISARRSAKAKALSLADDAVRVARESGMSFTGAWALGVKALLEEEPHAREAALAEGERLLESSSVGHNHLKFFTSAIEATLGCGEWKAAERYCGMLERYTQAEPLPMTDFVIARGRALARFGRGERDPALLASLGALREQAAAAGTDFALPALESALREASRVDA